MTSKTNHYIKVTHSQYSYKNGLQFNNKYENKGNLMRVRPRANEKNGKLPN